jgi:hypothetical protein
MFYLWTTATFCWAAIGFAVMAQASYVDTQCDDTSCGPTSPALTRTILVPEWSTESRTVTVTECRPEQRQRQVSCTRRVPYVATMTREVQVMRRERRTRTVTYTVRKPVIETATKEYVVRVPHRVAREGLRTVYHMVPVTEERVVREDHGHWEERAPLEEDLQETGECGDCLDGCADTCPPHRRGLFGRLFGGRGTTADVVTAIRSGCRTSWNGPLRRLT